MRKFFIIITTAIIPMIVFSGCNAEKQSTRQLAKQEYLYNHWCGSIQANTIREPQQKYYDITNGLEVEVQPTKPKEDITKNAQSQYVYHYSGKSLFNMAIIKYVHAMGLVEMTPGTDYRLKITIISADANSRTGSRKMELNVSLLDNNGKEVFSQKDLSSTGPYALFSANMFDELLTQTLEQINWNRIASILKSDKPTTNQIVKGNGNTELEQTIVRWDVQSRPQGADLFWRVVSKTPEVKSTNNKYLMTTPYEATKAMDIKGLTYQTASNVRIILRCEKDGYLPQEKEFDVRMILDQEEISAFFKLVKEDE